MFAYCVGRGRDFARQPEAVRAVPEPEPHDVSDRRPVLRQVLETALRPCCGRTSNGDSALRRVEVDVGEDCGGLARRHGWLGCSAIAPRSDVERQWRKPGPTLITYLPCTSKGTDCEAPSAASWSSSHLGHALT
jgi:hypothetical protein